MKNKLVYFTLPGLLLISITAGMAMDNSAGNMQFNPFTIQALNITAQHGHDPLQLSRATRGPECPATSGAYCAEGYNHCCLIKGEWTCVVELKDCKDD